MINTANLPRLLGTMIMLGVALALAALVMTLNTPVHANSAPDLEVGAPSVLENPDAQRRFSMSVSVTNEGDGASEATTLRIYRSTDSTITSSDTEEDTSHVVPLAAGQVSAISKSLTAPSVGGTYYYGACVDSVAGESDTTNNCSSSWSLTVSDVAPPDLAVLGIDTTATDGVETGESFRIGVTVQNLGDVQSAATTLRWLQETTGESDTELGTDAIRALNLHQANFETIRLTAPSTSGTYTYKACVDSVAGESDTTNNCLSVSVTVTLPNNLATGAPTISGTAQVGQTLRANTSGIWPDQPDTATSGSPTTPRSTGRPVPPTRSSQPTSDIHRRRRLQTTAATWLADGCPDISGTAHRRLGQTRPESTMVDHLHGPVQPLRAQWQGHHGPAHIHRRRRLRGDVDQRGHGDRHRHCEYAPDGCPDHQWHCASRPDA